MDRRGRERERGGRNERNVKLGWGEKRREGKKTKIKKERAEVKEKIEKRKGGKRKSSLPTKDTTRTGQKQQQHY